MTLKELANKSGVSIATVSRILNNKDYHCSNEETQQLIWSLVRESGYIPNETAKKLKQSSDSSSETKKVISCLFARTNTSTQDQFFAAIEKGIEKEAVHSGITLGYSFTSIDISERPEEKFLSNAQFPIFRNCSV